MATWSQPVKDQHELVIEAIRARYPDDPHNIVVDSQKRIVRIELPELSDDELAVLMTELQSLYPGAF